MKKVLKDNYFLIVVGLGYILVFIFKREVGFEAVKISFSLLKEMLLVLPPVMVISSLLMIWVPNPVIIKALGNASGIKGMFFAFLAGALTAGPIYAAFPVCKTLRLKGASIKNVALMLSTWAIIKIPLILIETHFLGVKFALSRYALSVPAVFLIAFIMGGLVREEDIDENAETFEEKKDKASVSHKALDGEV